MNNINRAVVKQQAKELIKGKVFQLFIIIFIVGLLTGSGSGVGLNFNFNLNNNNFSFGDLPGGDNYTEDYGHNYSYNYDYSYDYDDDDYDYDYDGDVDDDFDFDQFYENQQNGEENPIEDFEDIVPDGSFDSSYNDDFLDEFIGENKSIARSILFSGLPIFALLVVISLIVSLIFSPLQVTLSGLLVSFVRRNPAEKYDLGNEFSSLFKNTFNKYFWKKLGLMLLRNLITFLLSLLFIIPGIVYYYSTYFANQLMCDNPDLSPSEALELSKKMVKGHRGELFVLNLSFIPWVLLIMVTFGIATVYVSPYMQVTDALFYENFRLRALQNGVISQHEVTSRDANQASDNYFNGNPYGSSYADPYANGYNSQSYNPQGYDAQRYNGENYYSPQQDNNGTPTGGYYQPPADNNYNQEN